MESSTVEQEIRSYLVDIVLFGRDAGGLARDSALLGAIIDSTGLLVLVTFLQDRCGITIEDDDMERSNFATLGDVVQFVEWKLHAKGIQPYSPQ